MGLLTFSQTTSTQSKYPIKMINGKDTLICFTLEQAKTIATEIAIGKDDASLVILYKEKIVTLEELKINLTDQVNNCEEQVTTLKSEVNDYKQIQTNKNTEIDIKDNTIKEQKRKIIKQKVQIIIGYTLAAVLPIITLVATLK